MTQPVWITSSGSLGTVPEGIYYDVTVQAQAGVGETVFYRVIAGSLPTGTECTIDGSITGIPSATVTAGQDVVIEGARVTSKFTVRAYITTNNQPNGPVVKPGGLCDRTFTITVSGVDRPNWITPAGDIGSFYDGTLLQPGYQFEYTDNPLPGVTPISLVSGQLPPGISISGTGLLSGYFTPNPAISVLDGFSRDGQGFDEYGFDFNTTSLTPSYTYQFTLEVTNGVQSELRTFAMTVWNTTVFNASTTLLDASNTYLPASISNIIPPIVINPQGSIGTYRNDNFFAYQFIAYDFYNNPVVFEGFDLPPGLTLDAATGWLYGYIPNLGITEETYNFTIRVFEPFDVNPYTVSELYEYSVTFVGAIAAEITWISPSDLGSIENGETSTFSIKAIDSSGAILQYRLRSGSNSQLPQGLRLLPSGNIVGRVSFIVFNLDNTATTFDNGTTTFDLTYKFTVNAYSDSRVISVYKEFTIHVIDAYPQPYNNLYIGCMPPRSDRALITSLLENNDIFPQALLYRPDDPNFGRAQSVVYNHAYGLTAATIDDYVMALQLNHYWKNLTLGEIKTAQALDDLGNVMYEVVYSEVVDDQVNNSGESVSKQVVLPYPVNVNTPFQINNVYPNSLVDMRDQVIDTVGQVSNILPRWMYSKQKDGRILGFTPAWVIAYTNPNASSQIAYNIQQIFGVDKLNLIDFKADRYEIDRSMTSNWDPETTTVSITDITSDGTTATIDYAAEPAVTIVSGDIVTVSGVLPTGYNNRYYVLSSSANQITVASTQTASYISGGAITTSPHWVPTPATEVTFDVQEHYQLSTININPPQGSDYAIGNILTMPGEYFGGTNGYGNVASDGNDLKLTVCQVSDTGGIEQAFSSGFAPYNIIGSNIVLPVDSIAQGDIFESVVPITVITFNAQSSVPFVAGSKILISHSTPESYNGVYTVLSGTTTKITVLGINSEPYVGGGTIAAVVEWPAVPVSIGDEPAASSSQATITTSSVDFTGTITGTTLNFVGGQPPAVGQVLFGEGVAAGTYIVSGSGSAWEVNISQTTELNTRFRADTTTLSIGGDITGTFAVGQYILNDWQIPNPAETVANNTRIIFQITSTSSPVATTTATGTINTSTITVASAEDIAVGQLVFGTGISPGTVVSNKNGTTIILSQALTNTASGTYTFKTAGGAGTYIVNTTQTINTAIPIIGANGVFDILAVPGVETVFDGGSTQFINPADQTTNTNAFDRYLLYPKDNVINNLPQSVTWVNDNQTPIEWVNDETPPNPEAFWNT